MNSSLSIYFHPCFCYCVHSVHIKVHVPELVKKHTHVRTIYKHHYKPSKPYKPKTKTKHYSKPAHYDSYYEQGPPERAYGPSDRRRDPAIRHGTLHSKYQRYQWMDHLVPAASNVHEDHSTVESVSGSTSQQEPDILTRWQHNFRLLNSKLPALQSSSSTSQQHGRKKKPISTTTYRPAIKYHPKVETDDRPADRPPLDTLDFRFFERYRESSDDRNPFYPESTTKHNGAPTAQKLTGSKQQSHQPDFVQRPLQTDQHIPTNHAPQHRPAPERLQGHTRHNMQQHRSPVTTAFEAANFPPPHLLKITEEDIRLPSITAPGRTSGKVSKTKSGQQQHHPTAAAAAFSVTTRPRQLKHVNKNASSASVVATSWDDYASKYHPYPEYIHAVADALRSQRPAISIDYSRDRDAIYSGDHGGPTAMALVQQPSSAPMASQEEFMPQQHQQHRTQTFSNVNTENAQRGGVSNYVTLHYNNQDAAGENVYGPSGPETTAFGAEVEYDGENGDDNVRPGSNESAELGPLSFDEVPYQTFTKRKNLLRNAHRE